MHIKNRFLQTTPIVVLLLLSACSSIQPSEVALTVSPHPLLPGEVFEAGAYIDFEGVQISFDGKDFSMENSREETVCITVSVVGVKENGDYELLQVPAFYGIDESAREEDLQANGWAVPHYTNKIRPGEELTAHLYISDLSSQSFPPPDVDGDGYCDIAFSLHVADAEGNVSVSTNDPESDIYKIAAP